MLSERANRIALSPTLRINARATQMRAQGIDVVDFSVGEPDFPSPEAVKRAAKAAIDANFTKYTANDGIPELKKAICEKLERENGLKYAPDEIIVSAGAKNSLFNVAMALYDEGDDILIPAPYWVSYPDQVKLAKVEKIVMVGDASGASKLTGQVAGVIAQLPAVVESLTGIKLEEILRRGKKDEEKK